MTISELIKQLGGTTRIARQFRPPIPLTTVAAWRDRNNIPYHYWPGLARMSQGKLTEADLLNMHLVDSHARRPRSSMSA